MSTNLEIFLKIRTTNIFVHALMKTAGRIVAWIRYYTYTN